MHIEKKGEAGSMVNLNEKKKDQIVIKRSNIPYSNTHFYEINRGQ